MKASVSLQNSETSPSVVLNLSDGRLLGPSEQSTFSETVTILISDYDIVNLRLRKQHWHIY